VLASTKSRLLWLTVYAISMAVFEAAVVVYLRELYYPDGFDFPLVILRNKIALIELVREISTVLMILAVARLASRDAWRRFGAFLYVFGVWDIFYYVGLYAMLGWPESLLTTDLLFLIPLPWVGPVLAPALIAAIMATAGVAIEVLRDQDKPILMRGREWVVVILSATALLVVFMWDAFVVLEGGIPRSFPWLVYLLVLSPSVAVAVVIYRRSVAAAAVAS